MMAEAKEPIFDRVDQAALIRATIDPETKKHNLNEYIPIWLMFRYGVEPSCLISKELTLTGGTLSWLRPQNKVPRSEEIHKKMRPKVDWWLQNGRKRDRRGYNYLINKVGERVGHPEYSYMTLYYTSIVNQIRSALDKGSAEANVVMHVSDQMGTSTALIQELLKEYKMWVAAGGLEKEKQKQTHTVVGA